MSLLSRVLHRHRAKYIVGTAKELQAKPGGGEKWLASLREELSDVIEDLCTLPGVGPKVAACIALFSLDQNHAIPVDAHVWKDNVLNESRMMVPDCHKTTLADLKATLNKYGFLKSANLFLCLLGAYVQKCILFNSLHMSVYYAKTNCKK